MTKAPENPLPPTPPPMKKQMEKSRIGIHFLKLVYSATPRRNRYWDLVRLSCYENPA